ncbi:MAG: hypothetical protein ED859_06685 [Desulfuromonadales bacterium]|nr:MAG: hypothetical protein ED859_06685 [Desulfuromonadales bacterium]
MSFSKNRLVSEFVSAMQNGEAALFIGAGMSRPAGFVDWKGLLRDCAEEIGLNLDREHDLVAVAQYYINSRIDRARLNQVLKREFDKSYRPTINHSIISRLPIRNIWTTNFDTLIEDAIRHSGKKIEVISNDSQIAIPTSGRDVMLYKMHGDIADPSKIIICKNDYENYSKEHELFQNQLSVELVSKTFLFLGFSFSDPNLNYMLGHLRSLLSDKNKRAHYAIMRKTRLNWHMENKKEAEEIHAYDINRQNLHVQDLKRYSINTTLVDDYDEVTKILECIEKANQLKNVFVSGSAHVFDEYGEEKIREFCFNLGRALIKSDYKIITGMGLNIGDTLVKGAILELHQMDKNNIEQNLLIRPFPKYLGNEFEEQKIHDKIRTDMISKSGIAVIISGTSRTSKISAGVMREYEMARQQGKYIIPVGVTGYAAKHIWEIMQPEIDRHYDNKVSSEIYRRLNDSTIDSNQLIEVVLSIANKVSNSTGCYN